MDDLYFDQLDLAILKSIAVNDLIVFLAMFGNNILHHEDYQDPFWEEAPDGHHFINLSALVQAAQEEAAGKDINKTAKLEELCQTCVIDVKRFVNYAEMRAARHRDQRYLDGLGLKRKDTKRRASRSAVGPVGPPERFTVKHGLVSGSVIFQVSKVVGAAHYDLEYCMGDPNNEAEWMAGNTFLNTRHIRQDGLQVAKLYYFRIRCLGPGGFGPWTNVIRIIVV